jgi:hypothetical protein
MFLQVKVWPQEGPALRFFYRDLVTPDRSDVYEMNVQPFSSVCSPTICANVLRQAVEDGGIDAANVTTQIIDLR